MLKSDPTHRAAVEASESARVRAAARAAGYSAPPPWFRPPRGASAGSVAKVDAALYALMAAAAVSFIWWWRKAGRSTGTTSTRAELLGVDVLGAE